MNTKATRKRRNMRNTVIMALLCVALLGSATYAWFTLSESAKITNLSLTVGEASGLLIAPADAEGDGPGNYSGELALDFDENSKGLLMPAMLAQVTDGDLDVLKPDYDTTDGNKISGFSYLDQNTEVMTDDNMTSGSYYVYEKVFYLKSSGSDLAISLKQNDTNDTGTYIKDASTSDYPSSLVLKIAFFDSNNALLGVYEPNSGAYFTTQAEDEARTDKILTSNITYKLSSDNTTVVTPNTTKILAQNAQGAFTNGNSDTLVTLQSGVDTKITMKVYFDGEDLQCVNAISLNKILGQIVFSTTEANSNP